MGCEIMSLVGGYRHSSEIIYKTTQRYNPEYHSQHTLNLFLLSELVKLTLVFGLWAVEHLPDFAQP
jgi:hypothetical protein